MYLITADIINSFTVPASEKYDESFKIQLLSDEIRKDGQLSKQMVTLSVPRDVYSDLSKKFGTTVTLPVGFMVRNNSVCPYFSEAGYKAYNEASL